MGAGQIGGIAPLLSIDFQNAAGFLGDKAENIEGNYMVYFLSHAVMFCAGALIEAHVVLAPAICVDGWAYKFPLFAGTHHFLEGFGAPAVVENVCIHEGYNRTTYENNIALLVLGKQFGLRHRQENAEYIIKRIRYGHPTDGAAWHMKTGTMCEFFGWGSRRNGFLVPLLIASRKVRMRLLDPSHCDPMWNYNGSYLCMEHPQCRNDQFGALCPDDLGSLMVCEGYATGMMVSRMTDRPCGIGFLNINKYNKFITCGVDDADEVYVENDGYYQIHVTAPARPHEQVTEVPIPTPVKPTVTPSEELMVEEAAETAKGVVTEATEAATGVASEVAKEEATEASEVAPAPAPDETW